MKAKRIRCYGCMGTLIFVALGLTLCCSASAQQQKPGDVWRDPVLGMEFVWVPGGCFEMGCWSGTADCIVDERPKHAACVAGFWIGKYEVTQGQWRMLMGDTPSKFKNCGDNCPVEQVSWDKAAEFARRLSQKAGHTFRLPTEAEWEYACRSAGRPEQYSGGDKVDTVAWYRGNSGGITHPVGQKRPNGLGIYDMSGNVWEWCQDWYGGDYYGSSPNDNPRGPSRGSARVNRGGSWGNDAGILRCSARFSFIPDFPVYYIGFRLVRVVRQ